MRNVDVKKIVIAIICILVVAIGVFFIFRGVGLGGKKYTVEKVSEEDAKYFEVYTNGKFGVINDKGEMIIQSIYDEIIIPNPTKAVFICKNSNSKSEILNENKERIFDKYDNVEAISLNEVTTNFPYEKSVLRFKKDEKYGLIDFNGKVVAKSIYDELESVKYKEGEILAKKNGKYGVISSKGKELIPFKYTEIVADTYYDGSYEKAGYIVKIEADSDYKYGYIDYKWKKLLDTEYTGINRLIDVQGDDIYLAVAKNGQYGLMRNKKQLIDFSYQAISYNRDAKLLVVQRSDKYGVFNLNGENIIPVQYRRIKFNGAYISAKAYDEDIYFNKKGEKVENNFIGMKEIENLGVYIMTNSDNLYGLVDKDGNTIIENSYLYMDYIFDKYFMANKRGNGVIDKDNNVVVDFKYDVVSRIGEKELIKAVSMGRDGDETTIFSKDFREIVKLKSMSIAIHDNYIEAYNSKEKYFINDNGEIIKSKDILKDNKLFAISKDGKWGFENKEGQNIIEPIYDNATEFNKYGFAGVKQDGKWGAIDESGNIIDGLKFYFGDGNLRPDFLGKYYKIHKENNEICYTDEIDQDAYYENEL